MGGSDGEATMSTTIDMWDAPLSPIFVVPLPLRCVAPAMFTPQVVSIGPLHNLDWNISRYFPPPSSSATASHPSSPSASSSFSSFLEHNLGLSRSTYDAYKEMEAFKLLASSKMEAYVNYKHLVGVLEGEKESSLLLAYGRGTLEVKYGKDKVDHDFTNLIAKDACFVVAVLHAVLKDNFHHLRRKMSRDDEDLAKTVLEKSVFYETYAKRIPRPLQKAILQDMLLLENQIPLRAIQHVIEQLEKSHDLHISSQLLELYLGCLAHIVLAFSKSKENVFASANRNLAIDSRHLLDYMYTVVCLHHEERHIPTPSNLTSETTTHHAMHGANKLHSYGISFQPLKKSLNMIRFQKGKLFIPKIHVNDDTERLFRNLVAYESCYKIDNLNVLSYLHFMDSLIDTPADVELLIEKGIITETIGTKEKVAAMWNSLCRNTVSAFSPTYADVIQKMQRYSQAPGRVLWAEFYRSKLSKPWVMASIFSASALLVMTLLILWYTILLYNHETRSA